MKITLASPWFHLGRHDETDADATDLPADPPKPSATDDKDWKAEAEKWKALSRKNEDQAKANAEAARKLADLETAQQTEAEKLAAKADAAEKRAADLIARTAKAEVKALADGFADRDDAVLMLGDLSAYVTDGDVDTEAIKTALAEVLSKKPHLAAVAGPRNPAPDDSQGRGGINAPTDYRKADKAEFDAELGKYGLRPRST